MTACYSTTTTSGTTATGSVLQGGGTIEGANADAHAHLLIFLNGLSTSSGSR